MDWTDLAQDKIKLLALVGVVTNIRIPKNVGNFLTS